MVGIGLAAVLTLTVDEAVAGGLGLVAHIAVTAQGAGVSGVAGLGTGGSRDLAPVVVLTGHAVGGPQAGGGPVQIQAGVVSRHGQVAGLAAFAVIEDHDRGISRQGDGVDVALHRLHGVAGPAIGVHHRTARGLRPGVDIDLLPLGSGIVIVDRDGIGGILGQAADVTLAVGVGMLHIGAALGTQTAGGMLCVRAGVATVGADRTVPGVPALQTAARAGARGGVGVLHLHAAEQTRGIGAVVLVATDHTTAVAGAAGPGVFTGAAADGAGALDPAVGHGQATLGAKAVGGVALVLTAFLVGDPATGGRIVHGSGGVVGRGAQIDALTAVAVIEDQVGGLDGQLDGVDAVTHVGHGSTGPGVSELGGPSGGLCPCVNVDIAPVGGGVVVVDGIGVGGGLAQTADGALTAGVAVADADTAVGAKTAGGVVAVRAVDQSHVLVVHALLVDQVALDQDRHGVGLHAHGIAVAVDVLAPQGSITGLRTMDGGLIIAVRHVVLDIDPLGLVTAVEDHDDAIGALVVVIAVHIDQHGVAVDGVDGGRVPRIASIGATEGLMVLTEGDQTGVVIVGALSELLALQVGPADLVDVVAGAEGIVVAGAPLVLLLTEHLVTGVDEGDALTEHDHGGGQTVHPGHLVPEGTVPADDDLIHQTVVVVAGHIVDGLAGAGGPAVGGPEGACDGAELVACAGGEAPGVAVVTGDGVTEAVVEEAEAADLPCVALRGKVVAILDSGTAGRPALAVEHDVGILGMDGVDDLVDGDGIDQARQIETEAVDVVLLHPVHDGVHDQVPGHGTLGGEVVAHAGAVGPVALTVETGVVVGHDLVAAVVAAVEGVVVDHVHDHVDAIGVEALDHLLELGDTGGAVEGIGGVAALGDIEVLRIVAPGVLCPVVQMVLIHGIEVEGRHELHMGDAQLLQVLQTGGVAVVVGALLGQAQILALPCVLHAGAGIDGHLTDVQLIDDGIGVGHVLVGADVVAPAGRIGGIHIHDHTAVAIGTHALGIGVGGLHGVAGEHHIVIVVVAAEVTGNGDIPCTAAALLHLHILDHVAAAPVAVVIDLHIDLLGSGSPHLEGGAALAPGGTQIVTVVGVLGSELVGVEDIVGIVADGAVEAAVLDLEAASLGQVQLTAELQAVAVAVDGHAGDGDIGGVAVGIHDLEAGRRHRGQRHGGLDPDGTGLVVVVGVAELGGGDHILAQHAQTGSGAGVQEVVDRTVADIGQVDEPVVELLVGPVALTDGVAQIQVGSAVHGVGGDHALVVGVGREGHGAGRLVAPEPNVPTGVIAALTVEVQDHLDLTGIGDGVVPGDHHGAVAVVAAHALVARIGHPGAVHHELVLMDTGSQLHRHGPDAVGALHQLGGGGAPVVHGACQIHAGSGTGVAEGDGGAVDLGADDGILLSGDHIAGQLALAVGTGGLDPDLTGLLQRGIADGQIRGLSAVPVVEDQAQALAGGGSVVQQEGVVAVGISVDDLAGPAIAGQGDIGGSLPCVGHHAVPAFGVDEVDQDAVGTAHAADGTGGAGPAMVTGIAALVANALGPDVLTAVATDGADAIDVGVLHGGTAGAADALGVMALMGAGRATVAANAVGPAMDADQTADVTHALGPAMLAGLAADGTAAVFEGVLHSGAAEGTVAFGIMVRVAAGSGIHQITQGQGLVVADGQGEGDLHAAGDEHLVGIGDAGSGVVQLHGGQGVIVALGHVPAQVVAGLHGHIAVRLEGGDQLTAVKLVDADGLAVFLTAVVAAVDPAEQVVGTGRAADGTGVALVAVIHLGAAVGADAVGAMAGMLTGRGLIAQAQRAVAVDGQGEGDLYVAGDEHLLRHGDALGGVVQGDGGGVLIEALGHVPLGVVAGLHAHIGVGGEGDDELAIDELVDTDVGGVFLAGVVGAVDPAEQVVVHHRLLLTAVGAGAAHIVVAGGSDALGVAVTTLGADVGHDAFGGTARRGGDCAGVVMLALGSDIAQRQGAVLVDRQSEGDLHAAGDEHLLRHSDALGGVVQGDGGGRGIEALGHIPLGVVTGLHAHIGVGIEGDDQLALHEAILTDVGGVFLAGVIAAVDPAKQVVFHSGLGFAASGTGTAHIVVAGGLGLVPGVAVTAGGTGVGGVAAGDTGGSGDHAAVVAVTGGLDGLGVAVTALATGEGLHTLHGAGGSSGDLALVIAMAGGLDGLGVAVAADGAGEGLHALGGTGGVLGDLLGVAVGAVGDHIAQTQRAVLVEAQGQLHGSAAGDPQLVHLDTGSVGIIEGGGGRVITGIAVGHEPALVVTGLHCHIGVRLEGHGELAADELIDADVLTVFLAGIVAAVDEAEEVEVPLGAAGGTGIALEAVAQRRDRLGVAVAADGAGEGLHALGGTGGVLGDLLGVAVGAVGDHIAQTQRAVLVEAQGQLHGSAAGDPQLVHLDTGSVGIIEGGGGRVITGIAVGHEPALVVTGLHCHIGVRLEGHGELAADELIDADVLTVFLAGIVAAVDEAEEVEVPLGAAGGTGLAHEAVALGRDLLFTDIATDGAGVGLETAVRTAGLSGDALLISMGTVGDHIAELEGIIGVHHQSEGDLSAAGHEHLVRGGDALGGVVQLHAGEGSVEALGHVPVLIVTGLHRHEAVAFEGRGELAADELVDTDVLAVFLAGVIAAVDPAEQIVAPHVTTAGAGIAHIAVTGGGDRLGVAVAAVAGEGLHAVGGTGGRLGDLTGMAVAGGRHLVGGVLVTALGAGVGGIALSGTGGSGDLGPVAVAGGGDVLGPGAAALGTGVGLHAVGSTGSGRGDLAAVIAVVTARATVGAGAVDEVMTGGIHIAVLVAVRAEVTGMGGVALVGTGGGSDLCGVLVAQLGDGLGVAVAADAAVVGPGAVRRTGGLGGDLAGVVVGALQDLEAQLEGLIGVHHQRQFHLGPAGDPHLVDLDALGGGVVELGRGGVIAGITVGHVPALVIAGLHRHIGVRLEGSDELAVYELVNADVGEVLFTGVVSAVDVTEEVVLPLGATAGTGIAHEAVTGGGDALGVGLGADRAGEGLHALSGTGGSLGDALGEAVRTLGDHIAQNDGLILVHLEGEGDLRAAGHEHLVGCGDAQGSVVQLHAGQGAVITLGHVPAQVVAGLHGNVAVGVEGDDQLAALELILADGGSVLFTAVVGTVDEAEQIVAALGTAGGTGIALVAVALGRGLAVGVGAAAVGTGMGGVAALGTGGGSDHGLVAVTDGGDLLGVAVGADRAGVGLHAVGGTGGGGGDLGGVAVALGRRLLILIAVSADRTGMGGVALGGTGGGRHLAGVAVARSRDGLGLGGLTDGAGVGLHAVGRTGSGGGHLTGAPAMAATVTALGAGAIGIVMARSGGVGVLVAVGAAGTGVGGIALGRTGGRGDLGLVVMAQLGDGFGLGGLTDGTGVGLHAVSGTGSRLGDLTAVIAVALGGSLVAGVAVATDRAGVGGVALGGTGGSRHLAGVAVALGGDGLGVGVAADGAGVLPGTGGGTGGLLGHGIGVPVGTAGDGVAELQRFVGVHRQSELHGGTTGDIELVGVDALVGVVQGGGLDPITGIAVGHVPAQIVTGLHRHPGIGGEGDRQGIVHELVRTDVGGIFFTGVVGAVDEAEEVVGPGGAAGGTGGTAVAMAKLGDGLGLGVAALGTGEGLHTLRGTGGRLGHLAVIVGVLTAEDRVAELQSLVLVHRQSELHLGAAGDIELVGADALVYII